MRYASLVFVPRIRVLGRYFSSAPTVPVSQSQEGGVAAEFLGSLPWYEEYPTTPATFILNGFIYSLLGTGTGR